MLTKIVYILVSDVSDYYLEQALLSVYSLRMYNRDAIIEFVVDKSTGATLDGKRSKIKEYVNELHIVDTPRGYSSIQKSRYLKTNLRKYIEGNFLFIDCDTIICGSLEDIDKLDAEIGMVADVNGNLLLNDEGVIERCHKAGFPAVQGKPYFNSGVIYSRDTQHTHRLYERWYLLWCMSDAHGVCFDQPALCQANLDCETSIKEISGIWNCQFKYHDGYKLLNDALILHYYSNNGQGKSSHAQKWIFAYIKEKGEIDYVIDNMVRHPKTILYTVMTINDDKAFEFFNSDMLYIYFNVPRAYRIAHVFARRLERLLILINKYFQKN